MLQDLTPWLSPLWYILTYFSARPQFTTYPSPVDAREPQKPVVFKCRAKGSPTPQIKWFKDGLLILGTPEESRFHITIEGALVFMGKRFHVTREGSLIIFDPRMEDEGTYKCAAENELGKVSYDVSLYVEMSEFNFSLSILTTLRPMPLSIRRYVLTEYYLSLTRSFPPNVPIKNTSYKSV